MSRTSELITVCYLLFEFIFFKKEKETKDFDTKKLTQRFSIIKEYKCLQLLAEVNGILIR
jgi:hypothetical protein